MDLISIALLIIGFPMGMTRLRKLAPPLSKFLVYVVAPILGFWAGLNLRGLWLAAIATLPELIVFYLSRLNVRKCEEKGAIGITSAFGNTIFLGIPVVMALNGSVDVAVVYAMVTTFLHYTLAGLHACKKGSLKIQPFAIAFILGVLLMPYKSLLMSLTWTKTIAAQLSKLGLLILGMSFEMKYLRISKKVLRIGFFKHLVLPLLTLPFIMLAGNIKMAKSIVLESSMPPAFMNIALAYVYGYDVALVTQSVITLTLLWLIAFISLYLFQLFLQYL